MSRVIRAHAFDFFASVAAFCRLIFDHLLWPAMSAVLFSVVYRYAVILLRLFYSVSLLRVVSLRVVSLRVVSLRVISLRVISLRVSDLPINATRD